VGRPVVTNTRAAYWVWHDGTRWHLWTTPGRRAHRFHGFVTTDEPSAEVQRFTNFNVSLSATDDTWREGSHQTEHGVAFDVTSEHPGGVSWVGRYAQFDIAIDGVYRPRRVHLGPGNARATRVPFTIESP
jgi:hypothetical protein